VGEPVPPFVEGGEPKKVDAQTYYREDVPKNPVARWLWKYSQVVLSALTLAVVIFSAVQWIEYRNTRALENRAYIVAREVRLLPMTFSDVNDVIVVCVNAGRTPGRDGNVEVILERRQAAPPENTVMNPSEGKKSRILFGPGVEIHQRAGFMGMAPVVGLNPPTPNPTPNPPSVDNKTSTSRQTPNPPPQDADDRLWYLYGVITYTDIFGASHHTKFCFENKPFTGAWGYCTTFNDAD
jgi:hypothetical protein